MKGTTEVGCLLSGDELFPCGWTVTTSTLSFVSEKLDCRKIARGFAVFFRRRFESPEPTGVE